MCQLLAKKYNLVHIDISKYIIANKLYSEYNEEYDTYDFDTKKIRKALKKELVDHCVVETHTPVILKKRKFDFVFVMRTSNDVLYKRLEDRNYSQAKISANIDCEIFNEIGYDCEELFEALNYIENDTAVEEAFDEMIKIINKER